jgi:hypothetical protein
LVYNDRAHLNSCPQIAQEDDVMAERSYDEIEHELEAALAELQTNPPHTLEDLAISIVHLQTLAQERTDLALRTLRDRVERLERRIESLGQTPP